MCKEQKKVLAIHDISCIGRCSLTVALPILSSAGHNTGVLPTAVLSTHTGEFTGYVVHDLSDELIPIAKHLSEVAMDFDAIYTGYLANAEQVDHILYIINLIKKNKTLIYVDPAFADNGKLYAMMDINMVKSMRKMIEKADIIIPNITEAMFLLDRDPSLNNFNIDELLSIARDLSEFGPNKIIITGIHIDESHMGTFYLNLENDNYALIKNNKYDGIFHGTGDVIASTVLACYLKGLDFKNCIEISVEFIEKCIELTIDGNEALRYGVRFEQALPWLINKLNINTDEDFNIELLIDKLYKD